MLATPQSRLRRASSPYTGEPMGRGERVREICLPRSGYSTQRLPSAEERQAGGRTGTPSPASGEGRGKGADVPTAPYKHRLAHASGRQSRSERANRGPRKVARPCGERRTHRSGEGCPQCNGGSARLKRRLRPTSVGVSGCPRACFASGDPNGSRDPLGKGGAAERWRVVYSVGIATRHGA